MLRFKVFNYLSITNCGLIPDSANMSKFLVVLMVVTVAYAAQGEI